jgi:hypothetical protein
MAGLAHATSPTPTSDARAGGHRPAPSSIRYVLSSRSLATATSPGCAGAGWRLGEVARVGGPVMAGPPARSKRGSGCSAREVACLPAAGFPR